MKWEVSTIGEHCTVTSSKRFHLSDRSEVGIPFYCSKEIIQKVKGEEITDCDYIKEEFYESVKNQFGVPESGDLLITTRGTYGIPYIYRQSDKFYFADGNLTWLKDFDASLDVKYLYYWILSHDGQKKIDAVAKGTAQKAVPIASIKLLQFPLPPIEIQRRIADTLSTYDNLIENNQKQIKLLEEAAQRLYKEWFIDLRFPGHESTPIHDGIPEGWERKTVADVCETVGGGTPSTSKPEYYDGGTIHWVTPSDLTKKRSLILLETEKRITQEGYDNSSAKMVPPETILITSRASIGFFALCEYEVCTNQGFISCIPSSDNLRFFLLFNLMSRIDEIKGKATGSTFLEIAKRTFREMHIVVPTENTLMLFTKQVKPIISQIRVLEKENVKLRQARDRLLPKLMSGEIEV